MTDLIRKIRRAGASDLWTPARLKAHAIAQLGGHPLMVVSNREPYMHVKSEGQIEVVSPAGGLVTALNPLLRAVQGIWIAHGAGEADWEVTDGAGKVMVPPDDPRYQLKRVRLTDEEVAGYYNGFSNEALWPLCHLAHERPVFRETDWAQYRAANQRFAEAVLAECDQRRPLILVHDYHFALLPRLIRDRRPDAVIGLFWHIPWPTVDLFRICPWKRELLEGMLGADFIGFHLQSYCHNFFDTANALLPVRIDWDHFAILQETPQPERATVVKPFPISIQPWEERGVPTEAAVALEAQGYRTRYGLGDHRLIVSVDRLDYTKGIPERLYAIDCFFDKYPSYRERVVFVQLCAPSRTRIPRYQRLNADVEHLVAQINAKYATAGWKPLCFLKGQHKAGAVCTFLRMADVCIVSSLADGMNLVAKEYVAARFREDGVLILSEFTGAARELPEALLVNPYAGAEFADMIAQGLAMPPEEQQRRMARLKAHVTEYNVYRWAADLITEMARAAGSQPAQGTPERTAKQAAARPRLFPLPPH